MKKLKLLWVNLCQLLLRFIKIKIWFYHKSPPASHFIREAAKLKSGSSEPGRAVAGSANNETSRSDCKRKNEDLNAFDIKNVNYLWLARSMGIEVKE